MPTPRLGMRERPIEFAGLGIERTEWQRPITDASYRYYLGIVSSCKNLIRFFEVLVSQSGFDHFHSRLTQEPDDPLPGNAGKEGSIWDWCKNHAIFGHKNI